MYVGAVDVPGSASRYLPMPAGSFFYVPSSYEEDEPGALYLTWESFDPGRQGAVTFDGRVPLVMGAEMLRVPRRVLPGGEVLFVLDGRGPSEKGHPVGSFAGKGQKPWA